MDKKELIKKMFEVGAHYGYSHSRRHPSMRKALFGVKDNVEIIDLEKTVDDLNNALEFVKELSKDGKKILFVGSKNEARDIIEVDAKGIGMPYIKNRWIGGTITNFDEIRSRIKVLADLIEKKEKGEFVMYTKKERLLKDRKKDKLEISFGGLSDGFESLPSALFVIDSKHEAIAVTEAKIKNIPVIALVNSDCDIRNVKYPIPANDGTKASIEFFVKQIVDAYKVDSKE